MAIDESRIFNIQNTRKDYIHLATEFFPAHNMFCHICISQCRKKMFKMVGNIYSSLYESDFEIYDILPYDYLLEGEISYAIVEKTEDTFLIHFLSNTEQGYLISTSFKSSVIPVLSVDSSLYPIIIFQEPGSVALLAGSFSRNSNDGQITLSAKIAISNVGRIRPGRSIMLVDINGDLISDIVIDSKDSSDKRVLQFFINDTANHIYTYIKSISISENSRYTFSDCNNNGCKDLIILDGNNIQIYKNYPNTSVDYSPIRNESIFKAGEMTIEMDDLLGDGEMSGCIERVLTCDFQFDGSTNLLIPIKSKTTMFYQLGVLRIDTTSEIVNPVILKTLIGSVKFSVINDISYDGENIMVNGIEDAVSTVYRLNPIHSGNFLFRILVAYPYENGSNPEKISLLSGINIGLRDSNLNLKRIASSGISPLPRYSMMGLFGLRSPVQQLTIGFPGLNRGTFENIYTTDARIIPNSEVILTIKNFSKIHMRINLNFSYSITAIALVMGLVLLTNTIGVVVLKFLHMSKRRRERKLHGTKFNFEAL